MQSCEPSAPVHVAKSIPPPVDTIEQEIQLSDTTERIYTTATEIVQMGEARFFTDSIYVVGEGFSLQKHTDYAVVRILFDDDGRIKKVETLSDLPFKRINKNTIYLKRGANLTRISRYFGVPIQKLLDCNPSITNPNHLQAMTNLKINCNQ